MPNLVISQDLLNRITQDTSSDTSDKGKQALIKEDNDNHPVLNEWRSQADGTYWLEDEDDFS